MYDWMCLFKVEPGTSFVFPLCERSGSEKGEREEEETEEEGKGNGVQREASSANQKYSFFDECGKIEEGD